MMGVLGGLVGGLVNMGIKAGVDGQRNWTDVDPLTANYNSKMEGDNYNFGGMQGSAREWIGKTEDQRNMANKTASEREAMALGLMGRNEAFQGRADSLEAERLLKDAAEGKVPSQAEILARKNMDAIAAQQLAQAASARGSGAIASAQRRAMENTAMAQQGSATDSEALRAQEMATARAALANQSMGLRGIGMGYGQLGMAGYGQGLQAQGLAQNALGQGIGINEFEGQMKAHRSDQQNAIAAENANRMFAKDRYNKELELSNLGRSRQDRDRDLAFYTGLASGVTGPLAHELDGAIGGGGDMENPGYSPTAKGSGSKGGSKK